MSHGSLAARHLWPRSHHSALLCVVTIAAKGIGFVGFLLRARAVFSRRVHVHGKVSIPRLSDYFSPRGGKTFEFVRVVPSFGSLVSARVVTSVSCRRSSRFDVNELTACQHCHTRVSFLLETHTFTLIICSSPSSRVRSLYFIFIQCCSHDTTRAR